MSWKHWRENEISRKAKAPDKSNKYFTHIGLRSGICMGTPSMPVERWKGYYAKLLLILGLHDENPKSVFDDVVPNECLTPAKNREEEKVALKRTEMERRWDRTVCSGGIYMEELWRRGGIMLLDPIWMQKIVEHGIFFIGMEVHCGSMLYQSSKRRVHGIRDCGHSRGINMISIPWRSGNE